MANEHLQSDEISADQLGSAMDNLLFRFGQEDPARTVSISYIFPGSERVKIEDRPFGRLGRYEDEDGQLHYLIGNIIPHNGGSEKTLTIKDGKVLCEGISWEQIGTDDQETTAIKEELSTEMIKKLFTEITDPDLTSREWAIEDFYQRRHQARGKFGRIMARVFDIDNRPHFF